MVVAGFISAQPTIIKLVLWRGCAVTVSVAGILTAVSAIFASSVLAPAARRAAFASLLIRVAPQLAGLLDHWLLIPTEVHLGCIVIVAVHAAALTLIPVQLLDTVAHVSF